MGWGLVWAQRSSNDLGARGSTSESRPWRRPSSVVREGAVFVMPVDALLVALYLDVFFLDARGEEPKRSCYR